MFKGSLDKWLTANNLARDVRVLDTGKLKTRGFPAALGSLTNLEEIVFRSETGNTLSTLQAVPPSLRCVAFIYCQTSKLPDAVFAHDAIEMVMIEGCGVKTLPERIGHLPKLRGVSFHCCSIKEIPASIFSNPHVTHADFSAMPIERLPDLFEKWENLVSLRLVGNKNLVGLPSSLCRLTRLEELVLHDCPILAIPAEILSCTGLRRLRASGLHFESMPPFVREMGLLEELDLSHNQIDFVPNMENLAHLRVLSLQNNPIRKIEALPAVETLKLRKTRVRSLDFLSPAAGARLSSLDVSENKLADFSNLQNAPHLQVLDVSMTGIEEFPATIASLRELHTLYADANQIRKVPLLPSVVKLHLKQNPIESLEMPPNIVLLNLEGVAQKGRAGVESISGLGSSEKLEKLNLSGNRLHHMPAFVSACTNLRALVAKDNSLKSIPFGARLEHLDVSGNNIEQIGPEVCKMTSLVYLDVSRNSSISCVPPGVCAMPCLEFLAVFGTGVKEKPDDFGANKKMVAVDSYGNYTTEEVASVPFAQLEAFAELYKK